MPNMLFSLFRRTEKRRYADLLQLDDYLLRDIGLTRTEVGEMMSGQRTTHTRGLRAHE